MQRNTLLGMSLGQMLTNAFDGTNRQKGVFDAQKHKADIEYKTSAARKNNIDADNTEQEMGFRTDDSLASGLVAGMQNGINGDNVANDFNSYLKGEYKPREQQGPAMKPGSYMPTPEYVSKFPQLQEKFTALKQMLALGDKNIEHLSGSIKGDQRNAATANITPDNAARVALVTNAIDGNDPTKITEAGLTQQIAAGQDNPNMDIANALLLSQGKTRFDNTGEVGTMDLLTGLQSLNDIGKSDITYKKAQANQANAGATENIAQANLANTRGTHIKEGKGDGSSPFKVDSSYQQALGSPAIDNKGMPVVDPFSGRQVMNRNVKEEENFLKWASDNKFASTDAAIGQYIAQGRPRATKPAPTAPTKAAPRTSPVKTPDEIKADFKSGKITRKQAEAALKAQGFK